MTIRSTPWWKIVWRIRKAQRRGQKIRIQTEVDYHGEPTWTYLGQRR